MQMFTVTRLSFSLQGCIFKLPECTPPHMQHCSAFCIEAKRHLRLAISVCVGTWLTQILAGLFQHSSRAGSERDNSLRCKSSSLIDKEKPHWNHSMCLPWMHWNLTLPEVKNKAVCSRSSSNSQAQHIPQKKQCLLPLTAACTGLRLVELARMISIVTEMDCRNDSREYFNWYESFHSKPLFPGVIPATRFYGSSIVPARLNKA